MCRYMMMSALMLVGMAALFSAEVVPDPASLTSKTNDQAGSIKSAKMVRDSATGRDWVEVIPQEFAGAINNPLKGFRDYKVNGYGLLERKYVKWNKIELSADDTVDRIIAYTNEFARVQGKPGENFNVKFIPRVYLHWYDEKKPDGTHWPADLAEYDYDSPQFQQRLRRLIQKMGQAWDNDPRIFAVQMGLIGAWGEHHTPAPNTAQRQLLAEEFRRAFKNKIVLVRHNDPEFMKENYGIYYDTFAFIGREPEANERGQFPWQAINVFPHLWKKAPMEGEVEYNWQKTRTAAKAEQTFGRTPDETMKNEAYLRYMKDKVRKYHVSYLGWISDYNDKDKDVLVGAAELQKIFGYRFIIESFNYPSEAQPGQKLPLLFTVRNTGSAPFYLNWPVAVALLSAQTREVVWSAPLESVDIRQWLPGEKWDSTKMEYAQPAPLHKVQADINLPQDLKAGNYLIALAILDRQGGMVPSARFAITNYFRGGWHPFGFIGVGQQSPRFDLNDIAFDSPAFDNSLTYRVPASLTSVKAPPIPVIQPLAKWQSDPAVELINPWRSWELDGSIGKTGKVIRHDGPVENAAGRRVMRIEGNFPDEVNLRYRFEEDKILPPGRYRFSCQVRGSESLKVKFAVNHGWTRTSDETTVKLGPEWREQVINFTIVESGKEETRLRFRIDKQIDGHFEITDTRLRKEE
jgi:Domain of unknown function (DUF4832)